MESMQKKIDCNHVVQGREQRESTSYLRIVRAVNVTGVGPVMRQERNTGELKKRQREKIRKA